MISVLTATIPGRERFLEENRASIAAQTWSEHEHLVYLDDEGNGCSSSYNRLGAEAKGDWIFILADDDLALPRCLEIHHEAGRNNQADVVYALPLVWGEDATQFCGNLPNVPATALIRTELWRDLSGYGSHLPNREDLDFFERAQLKGAKFFRVENEPTWIYRFHGRNKSRAA